MKGPRKGWSGAAKGLGRLGLRVSKWVALLCVAIVGGFTFYAVAALPDLEPWHTELLRGEFSAARDGGLDFEGYRKLEAGLFDDMRAKIARWNVKDDAFVYSRFNPSSATSRLVEGAPYNRTFRLEHPKALGHALLMHGLTDSP